MATIRFKRGTLAQLVSAAGSSSLLAGEPYWITDLQMTAVAITTSTYKFQGILQLDEGESIPTGYVGAILRIPV